MTREEALDRRSKVFQNYLSQNPEIAKKFVSASLEDRYKFTGEFYEKLEEKHPEYGKYKVGEKESTSYYQMYPGGTGEPTVTKEDVYAPLYDPLTERMYSTLDPEDMEGDSLLLLGHLHNERRSPKAKDIMLRAREIHGDYGNALYKTPIGKGFIKPLSDLTVAAKDKMGMDQPDYAKRDALERLAYPDKAKWEPAGELLGLLGGSMAIYKGLSKLGLANVVKSASGGLRLNPAALGATSAAEFGLGAAYNTPTFVLDPENPSRVMSGVEAMVLGTALNLGIDTIRAIKGKPKAEAIDVIEELNPEGWTQVKEGLFSKYADATPQGKAIAEQMQAGGYTPTTGGQEAKSAMQGENLSQSYRSMEQEAARRAEDFKAAQLEDTVGSVEDLQAAMQSNQIKPQDSTPVNRADKGVATTPEFKAKVEMEDRMRYLQEQKQKIKGRRGESLKENQRIDTEMREIRSQQVLNEAKHLTREERLAEEAFPGSVLGITPYAFKNEQELYRWMTREIGLRTAVGTGTAFASPVGEEHGPALAFLAGFALSPSARRVKYGKGVTDRVLPSLRFADGGIKPLDQQVKEISPLVWNNVQGTIMRTMEGTTEKIAKGNPFFDQLDEMFKNKAITQDDLNDLTVAIYDQKGNTRNAWFQNFDPTGELAKKYKDIEKVLDDMVDDRVSKLGHLHTYFPRRMKDYKLFQKIRGYEQTNIFNKAIDEWEKAAGVKATDPEKMEIILNELNKMNPASKHRKIFDLTVDDLPAYENLRNSYAGYIGDTVYRTEMNRFLGKHADDITPSEYGRLLGDSVGKPIAKMIDELEATGQLLKAEDATKLKDLLTDWARLGRRGGGDFLGAARNFLYSMMIGNPISTLSQIPDVAIMATKDPAAVKTALGQAVGNRKLKVGFDWLDPDAVASDIMTTGSGIRKTGKELWKDKSNLKKWNRFSEAVLSKSLKWSGFKKLDMAMKGLAMDTHFERLQKWANAKPGSDLAKKMERQLKPAWGDDYGNLVADLKAGNLTDRVKLALFNEVTGIHPVDAAHMPPAYVRNPKYRLAYTLKSFMLRHINFMRTELIGDIRKAKTATEYKDAWKTYATYVTLFGGTTMAASTFKDFALGRDITLSDNMVDSMVQTLTGINRFQMYQARNIFSDNSYKAQTAFYNFLGSTLIPAKPAMDIWADMNKFSKEGPEGVGYGLYSESLRNVPVVGKPLYWRLGEGSEKEAKKKAKKTHQLLPSNPNTTIEIVY